LQALYLITQGARAAAFRNVKTIAECLVRFAFTSWKLLSNRFDFILLDGYQLS
jgi:hypothetical protein